jgi:DNA/RNA endonuclease G (NUC1)
VQTSGAPPRGSYRLEASVLAAATQQDRKRVAAEALLVEANELGKQGGKTATQAIEKLEQAVLMWRELGEPIWVAWSLNKIGRNQASCVLREQASALVKL